jgi:hypothetical protein
VSLSRASAPPTRSEYCTVLMKRTRWWRPPHRQAHRHRNAAAPIVVRHRGASSVLQVQYR